MGKENILKAKKKFGKMVKTMSNLS